MSLVETFIKLAATAAVVGVAYIFVQWRLMSLKPAKDAKKEEREVSESVEPQLPSQPSSQSTSQPTQLPTQPSPQSPSQPTQLPTQPSSQSDSTRSEPSELKSEKPETKKPTTKPKEPKKEPDNISKKTDQKKPASVSRVSRYAYPAADLSTLPSLEERFALALSVGEECQLKEELKALLENNPSPVAYDGFEPSGRMHIAQGVMKKINVDKLTKCGFTYIFWVADWFAFLNHKMGGDLEKIKTVGRYFIEVWRALGMNMDRVKFLWASDEITSRGDEYWGLVLDIATKFSLTRVKRCGQIMGRKETDTLHSSQILYPCMQSTDIFFMEVDVCQLGIDQRKVNMLAREYAGKNKKYKRPVVLSHHMLLGLKQGQDKMSKSDPDSAIFMEDTLQEIERKIMNHAFCPTGQVYSTEKVMVNPVLDYFSRVFKGLKGQPVIIKSENESTTYNTYDELEKSYSDGKIKQEDLKAALAIYLDQVIKPVREQLQSFWKLKIAGGAPDKVVFHKACLSLKKDEDAIGKGNPTGTIFLDDTTEEIAAKVKAAYCPPKIFYEKVKFVNPCMDYYKNLVFESFPKVTIEREAQNGGNLEFQKYKDFEDAYCRNEIDPNDLKKNLVRYIDLLISPVREHFEKDPEAKALLEKVKVYRVTK